MKTQSVLAKTWIRVSECFKMNGRLCFTIPEWYWFDYWTCLLIIMIFRKIRVCFSLPNTCLSEMVGFIFHWRLVIYRREFIKRNYKSFYNPWVMSLDYNDLNYIWVWLFRFIQCMNWIKNENRHLQWSVNDQRAIVDRSNRFSVFEVITFDHLLILV